MELSQKEIIVLQQLAQELMEIASLPVQMEKKSLWLALNHCNMQRPMVMIDQIPWHEMDVDGSLVCQVQDPYWRQVETNMRQTIYKWHHMPADMVVDPYLTLPRPIEFTGYGIGIKEHTVVTDKQNSVVGHEFVNQIQGMEDVARIKTPRAILHKEAEAKIKEQAEAMFHGIAPYKVVGMTLHLGIWDTITQWMGVENIYIELMDRPELMHAIMERLTDANIALIEQMNAEGLFDIDTNLCHCSHTFLNDLPSPGCNREAPTSKDCWAFGMAQLFSSVSPAITDEFEVPYMQRLFPYFGAIYYGCCDRLDDRMDIVTKMPNIRKISCSPWSNREEFAHKLPQGYVMSNKPTPALVATDVMDWDEVRQDMARTVKAARDHGANLELILKDISTVRYQPQRLWEWSRIALEEMQR